MYRLDGLRIRRYNRAERLRGWPVLVTGIDAFGAYFDIGATTGATNVALILHNGATKDPGGTEFADPATQGNEYWQLAGNDVLLTSQPPTGVDSPIPANHARIHYYRPDGNYNNWSLYVYGATTDPTGVFCITEDYCSGYDSYGPYFDVGVTPGHLGFIIHNCTTGVKDPGQDQSLQIPQQLEGWVVSGDQTVFPQLPTAAQLLQGPFNQLQAYWIDATTIAVQPAYFASGETYSLNASLTAGLRITATGLTGGTSIPFTPFAGTLTSEELTRYPQLAGYALFKLPQDIQPAVVNAALKSQLEVAATAADGTLKCATGVQSFGALDALLAYSGKLGVVFRHPNDSSWFDWPDDDGFPMKIKVWAPTAQSLSLLLFDNTTDTNPEKAIAMHEHGGVWVADGDNDWKGKYYQLQAKVYVSSDQAIHRLDANGVLEMGSCCADTASEHQMMEKLMIDTVVLNAKEYKIDGFRFDAMGRPHSVKPRRCSQKLQLCRCPRADRNGFTIDL